MQYVYALCPFYEGWNFHPPSVKSVIFLWPLPSSPSWQDNFFGHNREWIGTDIVTLWMKNVKLKHLTYNDWVWRTIKTEKYFLVEKSGNMGKENLDQPLFIWEKYQPFRRHVKLTIEISAKNSLRYPWPGELGIINLPTGRVNLMTLHWETSRQYKVLWPNKSLPSQ